MDKSLVIGIAGGTASGKTSVSDAILDYFAKTNSVTIIKQDDYYKAQDHLDMAERIKTNYDHPMAFDNRLMIEQIKQLSNGEKIQKPTYDYTNHTRAKETEIIEPVEVIILEGLFVLENEEIRDLLDLKLYVDTDADIRFIRRLKRDTMERNRSMESVINQYLESVRPMHLQFVEPTKRFADVIIPEGGGNVVAIDLIITKISSILK
jgi:uridine kinase